MHSGGRRDRHQKVPLNQPKCSVPGGPCNHRRPEPKWTGQLLRARQFGGRRIRYAANLRHHDPLGRINRLRTSHTVHSSSWCEKWLMQAKPPQQELNLDPVTCPVGFAAVLCIMQTTIAAEMRDHDSWSDGGRGPRPGRGLHLAAPGREGGNTALVTTRLSSVLRRNTDETDWCVVGQLGSETRV